MRAVGSASALFFIFTIVLGNYVVLNLFIAMWVDRGAAWLSLWASV